jgi:GH24 family phage-related lysozyme (muramidase)
MIKRSFYKEKINVPNSDVSSPEKDIKTNTTIVNFLYEVGERSAANYLEKRIVQSAETKYSDSMNSDYAKNERIKQKELVKISTLNSGILERLDSIEKNMFDEQNTSIKAVQRTQEQNPSLQVIREESKTEEKGLSWFDMLLGALLGVGMLAFLKGFKNLGPVKFAIKMLELGWNWIKDKVIDLASTIAKGIMKPLEEILEFIIERLAKLPGMDGLKDKFGKNKVNVEAPKVDAKVSGKATPLETDKTGTKVNAEAPKVDAGKIAKETEKAAGEELAKVSGKAGGKSLLKKIPFLGLGVAGLFAADRISDGDYVGAGMELASGLMSIVPIIGTAGSVGMDVALLARDIKRMNDAVITKLDNEGIIDKGWVGDTTIEKWDKVKQLSTEELKALAEYEDLNKNDRDKVQAILYKRELEKVKVPESPEMFNDGVKIIFNDREILADTLLQSDNKLQEFLINNPFTDENSETTEIEVNGEKIKQIKFKDDELNKQYIELKEQYDRDFKKYKESRDSQLRNLKDIQEIEGELLTPDQVKNYQSSGMTMVDYSNSTTKGAAQQDVLGALAAQYKNVTMPTGDIVDRIKKNEGLRLQVYNDSRGFPTIGYGHLIKPGEMSSFAGGITKEQADMLFAKDFEEHKAAAMRIPSFSDHPKDIQDTLIDMTFNMGNAWYKKWPETMKMLQAKDYNGVRDAILKSKYATQVKGRALVNAKTFESGDTRTASNTKPTSTSDVKVPRTEKTSNDNINKLNKDNALEQKQTQVQNVENTNKNLVNTTSSETKGTTVINNTTVASAPKQEEMHSLTSLFRSYI